MKIPVRWNARYSKYVDNYYATACEYVGVVDGKSKYKIRSLHIEIMEADFKKGQRVDHIEPRETLNNRKTNLRITDNSKNMLNRNGKNKNNQSGYRNVFWNTQKEKWCVSLCKNYKRMIIGYYDDVDEAGAIAKEAREEYYGDFKGLD